MAETRFPYGVDVDAGHVGNVPAYVTADGARMAAGTVIVTGGSASFATGLATSTFLVATPRGLLSAGTAGAFAFVAGQVDAGGSATIRAYDAAGTASVSAGTAAWVAFGT